MIGIIIKKHYHIVSVIGENKGRIYFDYFQNSKQ